MTGTAAPQVTIGMTVHNAGRFLVDTLEALLSQDHPDFELVISDNASTDGSTETCQDYARRDSRIHFHRFDHNRGAVANWNRVLQLARGRYFLWASDHDSFKPGYLSAAVAVLEQDPRIGLVHSGVEYINEAGEKLGETAPRLETRGLAPAAGFRHLLWHLGRCHAIHGVVRREILESLGGLSPVWAMDMPLLTTIPLFGSIVQLDEVMYFRRENRPDAHRSDSDATRDFQLTQLDPTRAADWQTLAERELRKQTRRVQIDLLRRAPIGWWTRRQLHLQILACYWARWHVGGPFLRGLRKILPRTVRRSGLFRAQQPHLSGPA